MLLPGYVNALLRTCNPGDLIFIFDLYSYSTVGISGSVYFFFLSEFVSFFHQS